MSAVPGLRDQLAWAARDHRVWGFNGTQVACDCDHRRWMGRDEHLDHLAEVMAAPAERRARAHAADELDAAADEAEGRWPFWLRARAAALRGQA